MSGDLVSGIDERMWTEKEAAHLLHVGVKTMWVWRRDKRITFFRLPNGHIRYRRRDLETLLSGGMSPNEDCQKALSTADKGDRDGIRR